MNELPNDIVFEHQFWLQILGDHSRFIHQSLAPNEGAEIEQASHFIHSFDSLLDSAHQPLSNDQIHRLTEQALRMTEQLREFKLHLLSRHLVGKIAISLPPTFINHMVNELEEYQCIIAAYLSTGEVPSFHAVHHHLLWLSDAAGHAATITSNLDMVEYDFKQKSNQFTKQFEHFYLKAIELAGYLRTNINSFPPSIVLITKQKWKFSCFESSSTN